MNEQGEKEKERDEREFSWCCSSSWGAAVAERSEGERSEPKRSGATAEAGAAPKSVSRLGAEVVAKAKRRTFTAEYKQRILREADSAAATPGGVGALLRREGLYSSHLVTWRRERQAGILEALKPRKRGPRSECNSLAEENQKLRRQVGQLTEKLRKADPYVYPGTTILKNIPGIRTQKMLVRFEADRVTQRSLELIGNPPSGFFDAVHLQRIHRYLFQDVYDWVGHFRTVDIAKGNSYFAHVPYIQYLGFVVTGHV